MKRRTEQQSMKSVIIKSLALAALLLLAPPARAQDIRLRLDSLDKLEARATDSVDVTLDGSILRLVVGVLKDSNPEERAVKELVLGLKGIYVKVYEFDHPGAYSEADVDAVRSQLRAPAWSRMVGIKSKKEGENMEVYTLTSTVGQIDGLTVLTTGDKQLAVIQIIGTIDLEKLIKLSGKLGIPSINISKEAGKEPKE
jgi:hypothetical protein